MVIDWHQRYLQQSRWTKPLREYLLGSETISPTSRILEVGCGTGAICQDLLISHKCDLYGIDINFDSLEIATRNVDLFSAICGDALSLPFRSDFFDIVYCHYFLLWVPDPVLCLTEIKRVLRPDGKFLIFAEPDYSARIDFPPPLERIGKLQTESLMRHGADTAMGRKLPGLLSQAGFSDIQYGVAGFQLHTGTLPDWLQSEWDVIQSDLHGLIDRQELEELHSLDINCWRSGSRVLWVPTFYAMGIK